MRPNPTLPRPRTLAAALLVTGLALIAMLSLGATAGTAATRGPTLRVGTAQNATLDKRILVTSGSGLSLYTLQGERNGRWLCTDRSCLSAWPPLLLRRGAQPTGVRFLGVLRRPDGRRQVTYRGSPLYRYAFDETKGDVRGDGVGDVAVWHVAVAPRR